MSERVYIGMGDWDERPGSIGVYALDRSSGSLSPIEIIEAGLFPSFLAIDHARHRLHAVDEVGGGIRSYAIDPTSGRLRLSGTARGGQPVYLQITAAGTVLGAAYAGGEALHFLVDDRGQPSRGQAPVVGQHAHAIVATRDQRFAFVPCLGSDTIVTTRFDPATGGIEVIGTTEVARGSGPRHLVFDADETHAYLSCELSQEVMVFDFDATQGTLALRQTLSLHPPGPGSGADLHLHPSGRFLYASVRPADAEGQIAIYAVDAGGGLTHVENTSTHGRIPRNFALDPRGELLVVANRVSKSVVCYRIDAVSGRLTRLALTETPDNAAFVGFGSEP